MRGEGRGEKFKGECVPSGKFLLDARPARTVFPTVVTFATPRIFLYRWRELKVGEKQGKISILASGKILILNRMRFPAGEEGGRKVRKENRKIPSISSADRYLAPLYQGDTRAPGTMVC